VSEASATLTIEELTATCRHVREHSGLGLVVVDEISALQPPPVGGSQRERGVVRSLKLLARELAVPVMALSRVAVGWRVGRQPMLDDLSEVERHTADLVELVHRPELDDPGRRAAARPTCWSPSIAPARPG
jgi:replicative DNA helicase